MDPVVFFLGVIAVSFVEKILGARWVPAYFRYGIPLYRKRLPVLTGLPPGMEERLERFFAHRHAQWRLLFRRLSAGEIAFRNRFLAWGSSAPMFGLIRHSPEEGAVYVTGYVHWSSLAAVCWFAWLATLPSRYFFFSFLIMGLAMAVGIQVYRYRTVVAVWTTVAGQDPLTGAPPASAAGTPAARRRVS